MADTSTGSPSGDLGPYRAKRRFDVTPEPAGDGAPRAGDGRGGRFVVQRHRARRTHYDFRLELGGVLVSWAVPKGPPMDPEAKRLAVAVEDHPIEYIDFEGVIPAGEYGGGDVIVWDRGHWTHTGDGDPAAALRSGDLRFELEGEKLRGRFALVRRGRAGDSNEWLMVHKRDEHAAAGWEADHHPRSVLSGRTNDEVAADPEAVWHSDRPAGEAAEAVVRAAGPRRPEDVERDAALAPPSDAELQALDALDREGDWEVGGEVVHLTNLDKVIFPAAGGGPDLTKRDLVRHHARVAHVMVPYLRGRPVNLKRHPDGVGRPGFWHKELPGYAPEWVNRWENTRADPGETRCYAVADSVATLVWLANYGAVELHAWTSRVEDVDRPTWAMIDIDPGERTTWDDVVLLARLHRTALEHLGVEGRPKVTGKRGIQVWIPVSARYTFAETRSWVERLSRAVGATVPELVSWEWQKSDRQGLARLDYTQNAINRTLVAPYSTRARAGAPVSVPIEWDELDDPDLRPDRWTIETVGERLASVGDPFAALLDCAQTLPEL